MSIVAPQGESQKLRAYSERTGKSLDLTWSTIGALWVTLGVASYFWTGRPDIYTALTAGIVGIMHFSHRVSARAIAVTAFAAVSYRVLGYVVEGIWNPLIVWLICGYYFKESGWWASHTRP